MIHVAAYDLRGLSKESYGDLLYFQPRGAQTDHAVRMRLPPLMHAFFLLLFVVSLAGLGLLILRDPTITRLRAQVDALERHVSTVDGQQQALQTQYTALRARVTEIDKLLLVDLLPDVKDAQSASRAPAIPAWMLNRDAEWQRRVAALEAWRLSLGATCP